MGHKCLSKEKHNCSSRAQSPARHGVGYRERGEKTRGKTMAYSTTGFIPLYLGGAQRNRRGIPWQDNDMVKVTGMTGVMNLIACGDCDSAEQRRSVERHKSGGIELPRMIRQSQIRQDAQFAYSQD